MKQVNQFMTSILGPSWRSTVIGWAAAILNLYVNGMSLKSAAASVAMAAFGAVVKDQAAHSTIEQVQKATDAARRAQQ